MEIVLDTLMKKIEDKCSDETSYKIMLAEFCYTWSILSLERTDYGNKLDDSISSDLGIDKTIVSSIRKIRNRYSHGIYLYKNKNGIKIKYKSVNKDIKNLLNEFKKGDNNKE